MNCLLLVEDAVQDLRIAAEVAESLGIDEVKACKTVQSAMSYLETGVKGAGPLPDGIVLDLDLERESGFELLRYWYKTPQLSNIPVIVWSVVEELQEVCNLFKVSAFVPKREGIGAIREALERLVSLSPAK